MRDSNDRAGYGKEEADQKRNQLSRSPLRIVTTAVTVVVLLFSVADLSGLTAIYRPLAVDHLPFATLHSQEHS